MPSFGAISELPISALPVVAGGDVEGTGAAGSVVFTGQSGTGSLTGFGANGSLVFTGQSGTGNLTGFGADGSIVFTGQDGAGEESSDIEGTGEAGSIVFTGLDGSGEATSTQTGAGKRHKPILIDARGQIHEFATQDGANAFLKSLEPIEEKQIQAKAKRIVSAVVRTGSAFKPTELTPVKVISGPPELTALANMRAAILQGQLNALVNAQIQAEMQRQEDDELAAVAVMMMME